MTAMSDRIVTDVRRAGPNRAVERWQAFQCHEHWLRTVLRARLRNEDEVEDLLQDMARTVIESEAVPEEPERLAPWLYRVAVRAVLMYRRQAGRRRQLAANWADRREGTSSTALDPAEEILARETRLAVREALERLPELDRQVLLLKYTERWSYSELAAHLGVSPGAIEHRLNSARRRLRKELKHLQLTEWETS